MPKRDSEECVSECVFHVQMACSWHDSSKVLFLHDLWLEALLRSHHLQPQNIVFGVILFFFSFVAVYNQCSDWCLKGSVQLKYFFLSFFLSIGSSILYNLFHTSSREVEGTILHFINYCNCPNLANLNSCRWLRTLRQSHQRDVSLARRLYTPSKSNVRWCNLRWFIFKWKLTSCKTGCWL